MLMCTYCGSVLRPTARFCTTCGQAVAVSLVPVHAASSGQTQAGPLTQVMLVDKARHMFVVVDPMTIGRDPGNQLQLNASNVSRQHAMIRWQLGTWVVLDLQSANGTFVNDVQVLGSTVLNHGDRVRFGLADELLFVDPSQPPRGGGPTTPPTQQIPLVTGPQGTGANVVSLGAGGAGGNLPVLKDWGSQPPTVEGYVVAKQGPLTLEKDGKVGRAALSLGLGLINPALAFIPFAVGKHQIMITQMRIERVPPDSTRPMTAVTLVGDQLSIVENGDLVAIWGREEHGTTFALALYNYTTGATQQFRRS